MGSNPTTERLRCEVPGCRRTRKPDPLIAEWICAKHWALVPKHWRRVFARSKRRGRAIVEWRLWCRIKRKAIDAALGI